MWSGPRNLSTAMMYSFGNRPDFDVIDEPFYAAYLNKTGIVHPMRDEIIASQQIDPECVINDLLNKKYDGGFHRYQKHMTQHLLKDFDLTTIEDIGFKQQLNLFNYVSKIGQKPIVIDSFDIRKDPRSALECLCLEVGLEFMSEMLSWPKGGHKSDGVWASHWYGSVHLSEGFSGEEANLPILNVEQNEISRNALPFYSALEEYKLKF